MKRPTPVRLCRGVRVCGGGTPATSAARSTGHLNTGDFYLELLASFAAERK